LKPAPKKFCEILLDAGIIDGPMFDRALEVRTRWQKKIGQILLDLRYIDETILMETLALQAGIPTVDLNRVSIKESAIHALTFDIIKKYRLLPFDVDESRIKIAYCHNSDTSLVTDFSHTIQYDVELYLTTESQLSIFLARVLPPVEKAPRDNVSDSEEIAKQKRDVRKRIGEVVEAHDQRKKFVEEFFWARPSLQEMQAELAEYVQEVENDMAWVQKWIDKDPQASSLATFHEAQNLLNYFRQGLTPSSDEWSGNEKGRGDREKQASRQKVKRLVSQLIEDQVLQQNELNGWLRQAQEQHLSIPTLLVQKAVIEETRFVSMISEFCQIPAYSPASGGISRETRYLFTPRLLKRFCLVPLKLAEGECLSLAVFHPLEDRLHWAIETVLQLRVNFVMMARSEILSKIEMEFSLLYQPSLFKPEQKSISTLFRSRVNSLSIYALYSGAISTGSLKPVDKVHYSHS
jgi:hypothetical protein